MDIPDIRNFSHSVITSFGYHTLVCDGADIQGQGAPGSATWPTANRAQYFPFTLEEKETIFQFAWLNGTAVSGNVSVAVYDITKKQLIEGHTAQAGTSVIQLLDIADTTLAAGNYYMGMSMDNTTGQMFRSIQPTAMILQACGVQTQTGAYPLPDPAVFAGGLPTLYIPYFGLATKSVI